MKHLLAVCIGNICRSPLAQAALARDLQAVDGITVASAGLGALAGNPADPLAVDVGRAQGLDLSAHRARQLAAWMCQQADLILVMEAAQKAELERQFPLARGKVFRLGHYRGFDIADPYRQPREAFEEAWAAIAQGVADWVPRIRRLG